MFYQIAFALRYSLFCKWEERDGSKIVTHERVIHTSDEHRETRRCKFKILTVIKIVKYDAEIKPPSTFEIKSRTHQAEGTFINVSAETVMFRISHTPREGY